MPRYVPAKGNLDAKVMFIGEAPGEAEETKGQPFVGASGYEFDRWMHESGMLLNDAFITNVIRFRPPSNDISHYMTTVKKDGKAKGWKQVDSYFLSETATEHLAHLENEIQAVQPNVIVPMGNTALWATTGNTGILNFRGSTLRGATGIKVIPTLHPAYILRNYNLRQVVVKNDFALIAKELESPEITENEYNFKWPLTHTHALELLDELLNLLSEGPRFCVCDIETWPHLGQIDCIGFATSSRDAICIPLFGKDKPLGIWTATEEYQIIKRIREVLLHPNILVIGHNYHYDAQYLAKNWGIRSIPKIDTMILQHTLFPALPKSLAFCASIYSKNYRFWKEDKDIKVADIKLADEARWAYNCMDVARNFEVAETMGNFPEPLNLVGPVAAQQELFEPVLDMMLKGIRQDIPNKEAIADELQEYLEECKSRIEAMVGFPLNPNSPQQLATFFYDDLRQQTIRDRKTRKPTTGKDALERIAIREPLLHPLIINIINYKAIVKFRSFVTAKLDDADHRMRCTWKVAGTKTYRFASAKDAFGSGGNLQNLPKAEQSKLARIVKLLGNPTIEEAAKVFGETIGKTAEVAHDSVEKGMLEVWGRGSGAKLTCKLYLPNIRSLFIPDEGKGIIDSDLDRADLQVVVWEAEDALLKQMLREGVDIHAENAKAIGMSRQEAKIFVHGTNYGGGARTIAISCGITVKEAEAAQRRWFQAHPGIKEWHRRTFAALADDRTISNAFGYKHKWFEIRTKDDKEIGYFLGKALAWVPQSTVALVINRGLVNIHKNMKAEVDLLMQVHDSLVTQIPLGQEARLIPLINKELTIEIPYPEPLYIGVSSAYSEESWGAVKPYALQKAA